MNPISGLFGAGVALRNAAFDHGWRRINRLDWPVVSIGNLRVGGTGKTPFTILLGEHLQQRKIAFDVLSRGYRRNDSAIRLVDEKGDPALFGDEPLLIAQKLGVPVIVGTDRFAAGRHAEHLFSELRPAHNGMWLHLLDDGFQHRQLARDFDIVIVTPGDVYDQLLPVGRLREPLTSLQRADAIVLTEGASLEKLPDCVRKKHIWRVKREPQIPRDKVANRPIAFCGIARPERFFEDIESSGLELTGRKIFSDHYAYTGADIQELLQLRQRLGSGVFLTTEKDEINLKSAGHYEALQPIVTLPLKMEFVGPQNAVDTILGAVAEKLHCR